MITSLRINICAYIYTCIWWCGWKWNPWIHIYSPLCYTSAELLLISLFRIRQRILNVLCNQSCGVPIHGSPYLDSVPKILFTTQLKYFRLFPHSFLLLLFSFLSSYENFLPHSLTMGLYKDKEFVVKFLRKISK